MIKILIICLYLNGCSTNNVNVMIGKDDLKVGHAIDAEVKGIDLSNPKDSKRPLRGL